MSLTESSIRYLFGTRLGNKKGKEIKELWTFCEFHHNSLIFKAFFLKRDTIKYRDAWLARKKVRKSRSYQNFELFEKS